jgi:hypothetical protein
LKLIILVYFSLFYSKTLNAEIQNYIAKVTMLKGSTWVTPLGHSQRIALLPGDWVGVGALLETKKYSLIQLVFNDGSKLVLGPEGVLTLEYFEKKRAGIITLVKGQIRSIIKKGKTNRNKLIINTPHAAMGVRGTDYQIYVDRLGNGQVYVKNGVVAIRPYGDEKYSLLELNDFLDSGSLLIERNQLVLVKRGNLKSYQLEGLLESADFTRVFPNITKKRNNSYQITLTPASEVFAECIKNAIRSTSSAIENGRYLGR